MKVMKFGGTSVGTPNRMKEVTKLVTKSILQNPYCQRLKRIL